MFASGGGPDAPHRPVLLAESVGYLAPERGGLFVDATLGLGGHTEALLEASSDVRVLGIDRDPEALQFARARLAGFGERFRAVHANFKEIAGVLEDAGELEVSGVLADLGVSSLQFDAAERGFSFRHDAPLDMRMDAQGDEETAAELLARLPEEEIARIIFEYGEERKSRKIARWIVERREEGRAIETTADLAALVARAVGYKRTDRIHPATRTFQALRIAVNHELEGLEAFLEASVDLLQPSGRLVVISFHSLEDRIVKRALRRLAGQCECDRRLPVCACGARRAVEILTRRPVTPADAELDDNPRARSAKLRACRKLEAVAR
ncbi:MAG: rRNA (cytosine1402-N4)-methyltransferase [Pyrinomonadaceae bacterium]|nr:rRNA (cytosine1402-N4)-methyltransferase [Pyrinomonadaceae bacterium]MDQ1613930.1 rRNA (cytosine1402-N4)-methyltransferase [Pyrinomonadaceae bacterium]